MKYIVKLFPEITIKSQSVRLRFIKILTSNIRNILRQAVEHVAVVRHWDYIEVNTRTLADAAIVAQKLTEISGIHHILEIEERSYTDLDDIFQQVLVSYGALIENKTFCVRVKRRGKHDFTSIDIERYVGGGLNQRVATSKVSLTQPQVTVRFEVDNDKLLLIKQRFEGIGGFPTGTQEDVLSLISGGFDSSVASYRFIRRGSRVHYCFFNLGGAAHEIGVKQTAYYLWKRFGSSHKVRFVSVDFMPVVAEILEKVENGQMGVILKRMMVRAAAAVAQRYGIMALVTGEAMGQVSSQTLTNLSLIDVVTPQLILRPLITEDKEQIILESRRLGTEEFAKTMPEYCGVISKSPTIKAVAEKLIAEESNFDFSLLEKAIASAKIIDIREIGQQTEQQVQQVALSDAVNAAQDVVIDIRNYDEQEQSPLLVEGVEVLHIPFYKLASQFVDLDQQKNYLLYCDKGVMSRLQALYLQDNGFQNIKVYQPSHS